MTLRYKNNNDFYICYNILFPLILKAKFKKLNELHVPKESWMASKTCALWEFFAKLEYYVGQIHLAADN